MCDNPVPYHAALIFDYPLKGAGLVGSAPEVAASIHRKPEATC